MCGLAYIRPYIVMAMAPVAGGAESPANSSNSAIQSPSLQIRSALSNKTLESFVYPFADATMSNSSTHAIRLLTTSSSAKGVLYFLTTPTERNALLSEGSTMWCLRSRSWDEQIDNYLQRREYEDTIQLLGILDIVIFPEKARTLYYSFGESFVKGEY